MARARARAARRMRQLLRGCVAASLRGARHCSLCLHCMIISCTFIALQHLQKARAHRSSRRPRPFSPLLFAKPRTAAPQRFEGSRQSSDTRSTPSATEVPPW